MTTETIPETTPALLQMRARAEAMLTCPGCGKEGGCRRIGGGSDASRFRCYAYRFSPSTGNECRFAFLVADAQLSRFR